MAQNRFQKVNYKERVKSINRDEKSFLQISTINIQIMSLIHPQVCNPCMLNENVKQVLP